MALPRHTLSQSQSGRARAFMQTQWFRSRFVPLEVPGQMHRCQQEHHHERKAPITHSSGNSPGAFGRLSGTFREAFGRGAGPLAIISLKMADLQAIQRRVRQRLDGADIPTWRDVDSFLRLVRREQHTAIMSTIVAMRQACPWALDRWRGHC